MDTTAGGGGGFTRAHTPSVWAWRNPALPPAVGSTRKMQGVPTRWQRDSWTIHISSFLWHLSVVVVQGWVERNAAVSLHAVSTLTRPEGKQSLPRSISVEHAPRASVRTWDVQIAAENLSSRRDWRAYLLVRAWKELSVQITSRVVWTEMR